MTRIAIDARFYGTEHTGLGRYTTNVLASLPNHLKDHQLLILLRAKYYQTLKLPRNCQKILFDVSHYSINEQILLPLKLRALRADALYTLHFNAPLLSAIPTILTVHDLIKSYFSGYDTSTRAPWIFRLKRLGYHTLLKHLFRSPQAIIVPTNTVKNQILANYPLVNPEVIYPIPEAPDPIFRPDHPVPTHSPVPNLPEKYLLFVGNAYPHKNLQLLLEAHRQLRDDSLHLVLVAKHTPFLARTLAPYEPRNIHLLPDLSDHELLYVYEHARALVTPSLMEGYGLVGLEALLRGTRVIASNIPVYREVYGSKVTYFDPHSSTSLVSAIQQTLKLPRANPLTFTRSWTDVASSIAEVINESCARL